MCDEWMPNLRLRLSGQEFQQLPRHAAYKYDYLDGTAHLSPWPRHYHAQRDLADLPAPTAIPYHLRPARSKDEAALVELFAAAFYQVQPFGSLDAPTLRHAASQCLQRALGGGDGPWVESASFVAHAPNADQPLGATLITLLPGGDPGVLDSYQWREPPPADLWERCGGQPHLTWIFVGPFHKGNGLGSALLHASARVLRERGYASLWTTFLVGNEASMLWHWRSGFRLFPPRWRGP